MIHRDIKPENLLVDGRGEVPLPRPAADARAEKEGGRGRGGGGRPEKPQCPCLERFPGSFND